MVAQVDGPTFAPATEAVCVTPYGTAAPCFGASKSIAGTRVHVPRRFAFFRRRLDGGRNSAPQPRWARHESNRVEEVDQDLRSCACHGAGCWSSAGDLRRGARWIWIAAVRTVRSSPGVCAEWDAEAKRAAGAADAWSRGRSIAGWSMRSLPCDGPATMRRGRLDLARRDYEAARPAVRAAAVRDRARLSRAPDSGHPARIAACIRTPQKAARFAQKLRPRTINQTVRILLPFDG